MRWWRAPWRGLTDRVPRPWQDRLIGKMRSESWDGQVVSVVMGGGKTLGIAEVATGYNAPGGVAIVTVPTVRLVRQTHDAIVQRIGECAPGRQDGASVWYGGERRFAPIVVCCTPSLPGLVQAVREAGQRWDLWLADECHRTDHARVDDALTVLRPGARLGWSATPYHADEDDALRLWDREFFRYSAADALADGVLVPWVTHLPTERVDVDAWCCEWAAARQGPGIVSAASIADAEAYAEYMRARGVQAAPVHSRMADADVTARIDALRDGGLHALVHVRMLSEGVDMPWLRWGVLRDPRGSRVELAQSLGRYLRAHPGKDRAHIADPHDSLSAMDLGAPAALAAAWEEEPTRGKRGKKVQQEWDLQVLGASHEDRVQAARDGLGATWSRGRSPLRAWMTQVLLAAAVHPATAKDIGPPARMSGPATQAQVDWIARMQPKSKQQGAKRRAQAVLAAAMALHDAGQLNKAWASDAISIAMMRLKFWNALEEIDAMIREDQQEAA